MQLTTRRSRASSRGLIGGLTRAERVQRGRIGIAKLNGGNVRLARARFDELRAMRSLSESAEKLIAARVEQGLSPVIDDPDVLDTIASLIDGAIPSTTIRKTNATSRSGRSRNEEARTVAAARGL
ncbi:MAG TPA: hypothetical protein VGX27_12405 [Candidatus Dormibacteraeota bacterium]|nr:hypothetical protein [Candidatus Dormibacteraeota bacterium]